MGNESSKEGAVAAHHDRREDVPTKDVDSSMNTATNAGDLPTAGSKTSPRGFDCPESAGTRSSIPTKPSGFYRQRDHYSPPRRRSISPPPLRSAVAADRPSYGRERESRMSGASVHHMSSPTRPRHAQSPRSPIQHCSSPTRRRSPLARRPSSSNFQDSSRFTNGLAVEDVSSADGPVRSSAWELPRYQPLLTERQASTDVAPEKIVFNGLTGVPTGPKSMLNKPANTATDATLEGLPTGPKNMLNKPADTATDATWARSSPHIFISHSDCKTLPTSRKHLAKCLRVSERDVHREPEHGWRIVFEGSAEGRSRLEKCYEQFHLHTLFSMYVLKMHRFPNGIRDDMSVDGLQEARDILLDADSQQHAAPDPRDNGTTISANKTLQPATGQDTALRAPYAQRSKGSTSTDNAPANMNASGVESTDRATLARSSPVLTRTERDDSSSVSAPTTSDTSASKGSKCHVCRTPSLSGLEPMAHCSTCPRKYHRRCLPKDAAAGELRGSTSWQCQRCVKKQVPARSRLSNGSFSAGSPAPPANQHNGPTASITKQDNSGTVAHGKADAEAISSGMDVQTKPSTPLPDGPVRQASEADELVEKMFADTASKQQQPKKTGRLELKRTKIRPGLDASGDSPQVSNLLSGSHLAVDGDHPREKRPLEEDSNEGTPRKKMAPVRTSDRPDQDSTMNGAKLHEPSLPLATKGHNKEIAAASEFEQRPSQPSMPKQKLKFRPIPPHLRQEVPADSSVPKKKPHKWAGTGTEKGIIENGFKRLFSHNAEDDDGAEQSTDELVQDNERSLSTRDVVLDKSNSVVPSSSVGVADGASGTQERPNAAGPAAKRQRLANAATRPCAKCQRTIALNPSGSNLYCVRCRREMQEDSSTSLLLGAAAAASPASTPPDTNAKVTNSDSEDPDLDELTAMLLQGDSVNDATSQPPFGKLKKVDQRVACNTCRITHKRCTHGANGLPLAKNSEAGLMNESDVYAVQQTPTKRSTHPSKENNKQADEGEAAGSEPDNDDTSSEEGADPALKKAIKRRSFRTAAESDYDLGNSFNRPSNTYPKLVAMALCSADGFRMTVKEIIRWIASNIPNYNLNEGNNWKGGIQATVSQYRWKPPNEKQICKQSYWYRYPIDPTSKAKGSFVELMPGVEEIMPQWDPVLKTPVSPMKLNRSTAARNSNMKGKKKFAKHVVPPYSKQDHLDSLVNPDDPAIEIVRMSQLQSRVNDVEMKDADPEAEPTIEKPRFAPDERDTPDSSDDEPLFRRRQHATFSDDEDEPIMTARQRLLATFNGPKLKTAGEMESATPAVLDTEMDSVPALQDYFSNASPSPKSDATPVRTPIQTNPHLSTNSTAVLGPSLAQTIKRAAENLDYSASSLFDEWPEYDTCGKHFDKAAKIAEIQARPKRKQRFRMPLARDPWADPRPAFLTKASADDEGPSPASLGRFARSPNKMQRTFDPWRYENGDGEANVIECDTWEEFFDLPTNPIPILHDGQLAYREGLQNEDGTLRRAKVIFKTGYA